MLQQAGQVSTNQATSGRPLSASGLDLATLEVDAAVIRLVPQETARKHQLMPLQRLGATLKVAMADPTNFLALDEIRFMTGLTVEPIVAPAAAVRTAIERHYGWVEDDASQNASQKTMEDLVGFTDQEEAESVELEEETDDGSFNLAELEKEAEGAPVIRLVNHILTDAVRRGASDVHMEPYEREFRVRLRVDGILQAVMSPPLRMRDALISRVKIMAKLDISEKRLPQDGRILLKLNHEGKKKQIDLRVSVLPTLYGEKVVMRLLDKENLRLDMALLGFEPESLAKFQKAIFKPYGMVLVTGPTGSGKTNTLYSAIAQLNKPETNILTAEDPVEFQITGINQVQMKEQIGLNFAAALRSFLRQDPNIILVGEIRDFETAEIAIKAALTGHLVLSTLHTNDAPSTISRLMNMGIEPFLVATSVHLICAQRLVRKLCSVCKAPENPGSKALLAAGFTNEEARRVKILGPKGCPKCLDRGYKGRVGLYEVMEVGDEMRDLILAGASTMDLRRKAIERGMISLRRSGLTKVMEGTTSLEEVIRETIL
ncbi:MAG TPA: type IV-A pilus assembly ATPase PilB [Terriglobia bacterium]|nr:type IV-A pilus assembly ATPase PilB [Terriglobia bacterium]